jgi:hypothetical protein
MPREQALAQLERQLEQASELLKVTVVRTAQDLEGFKLRYQQWRDETVERLRLVFDQDEFANAFGGVSSTVRITTVPRVGPVWGFTHDDLSHRHAVLRRSIAKLESYRNLVRDGVIQQAPTPTPTPTTPARKEAASVTNIYNTTINTGGMVNINPGSVTVIQSHIEAIAGQEPDLAQALARLTEALDAPEFSEEQRSELRELIEDLTSEVREPPNRRRSSRVKAFAGAIKELAPVVPKFLEAWDQVRGLLGQG